MLGNNNNNNNNEKKNPHLIFLERNSTREYGDKGQVQRIRDKTYLEFNTEDQVLLNLVIETYLRLPLKSSLTIFLMKVGSSDAPFYENSAKK